MTARTLAITADPLKTPTKYQSLSLSSYYQIFPYGSQHIELSQPPYSGYPCLSCCRPHIYSELWQHYHEHFLMPLDPVRLSDLILELNKSNWPECSRRIKLLAPRTGYTDWLKGTLKCPDKGVQPKAYHGWVWEIK